MVSAMASAYEGLSDEERERVFLLSVGRDAYTSDDQNFCQGFAACADQSDGSWWTTWDVAQRDVFFYIKTDPMDDNSWEYYCDYSMNTGRDEFDDTIREMLAITEKMSGVIDEFDDKVEFDDEVELDVEVIEDASADNETSIEPDSPLFDPVSVESGPSQSYVSSSSSSPNCMHFLILSAAALSWSIA